MSPFGIFTIVLISLYIVYYAVLITRDIYGKNSTVKSEEEEFDISSFKEDEMPISVEESEDGFSLIPSRKNDENAKTVSPVSPATVCSSTVTGNGAMQSSGASEAINSTEPKALYEEGRSATQKKIEKVQEEMDEIATAGNLTMSKEFFRDLLLQANKEGSLFVRKKHVSAV